MAGQLNLHEIYMGLTFRPVLMSDGGPISRVGVQLNSPLCVDPELYPNLLTAAPAMYQLLSALRQLIAPGEVIDAIETVLAFAQNGYLNSPDIDQIIQGLKK